jgi:hypothetical protein
VSEWTAEQDEVWAVLCWYEAQLRKEEVKLYGRDSHANRPAMVTSVFEQLPDEYREMFDLPDEPFRG